MSKQKLFSLFLLVTLFLPAWVFAQGFPGGRGSGTITACPSIPELEGMNLEIVLGPGTNGPSSSVIEYATLDGNLFGPPCDILYVPPSTLYIECGPHQAQLTVNITPISLSSSHATSQVYLSRGQIGY